jgi:hypothetical protein
MTASSIVRAGALPRLAAILFVFLAFAAIAPDARAQAYRTYTIQEIVDAGHGFFGSTSGALAGVIERNFEQYGLPNGYILGEEAGGAFIGGLRYGEGVLVTKNAGERKVYWQGPSIGWDYGVEGNRTMMLVYNLPDVEAVYDRFYGVSGSAFFIGGLSATALTGRGINVVPVSTGLGARLGVNVGYIKMTATPVMNPF